MRTTCAVLALSLCVAGPACAQTLEETVATIFYTAGGGTSPNIKLVKTGGCKFRMELYSRPTYEVDFALLARAEIRRQSAHRLLLTGASSLFATVGDGGERATTLTIFQAAGTGGKYHWPRSRICGRPTAPDAPPASLGGGGVAGPACLEPRGLAG